MEGIIVKIAVMTDSTAYIPKDLVEKYNIHTVPLAVVFGDEIYREEVDISPEEFYQKVRESEKLPTTSQPSVGDAVTKLEELAKDYDAVISIHISSELSGTYNAVISAGEMVEGIKLYAFDSKISAMALGFFVLEAAKLIEQNKTPEEILKYLHEFHDKVNAYFMVDDLSHLQRGGRLSGAQAFIGSLLKIKPILHIVDGKILPFEKIRTTKKALQRILNLLEGDIQTKTVKEVVFIHANNEAAALNLEIEFKQKHPEINTLISYFGPVLGTHLGEGALGILWYTE